MTTRREFIRTMTAAAGTLFMRPTFQAPAPRREILLGNRRIKLIDIHGHFLIPEELELVKGTPLESNISGQPNSLVLGPARIAAMDQRGIDVQALSHQGGWWYGTDRDLARRLIKVQNEKLAEWCRAHPDRFVGLASVALQHPDLAAEQLDEAVKRMGLRGVGIAGYIGTEVPSSPRYDPFWARVQELGALVFVHPTGVAENIVRPGVLAGRGDLGNIIGNPLETTLFLSRLIFDGTLDRFPGVKICGAHAGGYLPSYIGRTEVTCSVRTAANCQNRKRPSEYLKQQIMVDSMIFSEEGLRHLVAEVGVSQIVYGTDIPYNWPDTADLVLKAPFLKDADKEAILSGNLMKLLKIAS
jgi:aminocarboxymuconate-semialdehyde decarboxylase